jgi:NADH-quinone oxidoreductase subunit G
MPRAACVFNSTIAGIDKADVLLLIGSNPRQEAPVLNARLRKRYLKGGFKAAQIGPAFDATFPITVLGEGPDVLQALADGTHPWFETLKAARNPMIILGSGAVARVDGLAILDLARRLADAAGLVREDWNGFNVLQRAASRVGGLDIGFVPGAGGRDLEGILEGASKGAIEAVYVLGADEFDTARLGSAFVVYQGHHGDKGAARADVVLPGAAYTEKNGTYVNTEGRVQLGRLAVYPPGDAKEDWRILRALSEQLGRALPYDSLPQLRQHMLSQFPLFAQVDDVVPAPWLAFGAAGPVAAASFTYPIDTYYMTDPISRASPTMAECVVSFAPNPLSKTGTYG